MNNLNPFDFTIHQELPSSLLSLNISFHIEFPTTRKGSVFIVLVLTNIGNGLKSNRVLSAVI